MPPRIHAPNGARPVGAPVVSRQYAPPTPWAGDWQPTEQELARWGGSAELLPTGNAIDAAPPVGLLDVTFPVPLAMFVAITTEVTGAPTAGWNDDIIYTLSVGSGRANMPVQVRQFPLGPPAPKPFPAYLAQTIGLGPRGLGPLPMRQLRVSAQVFSSNLPSQQRYRGTVVLGIIS
jgi:hypothetical protein